MARRPRSNYREDLLVEALARGASQQEAAMAGGISSRTVRRRLEQAEFVAMVKNARCAMLDRAIGATAAAAKPAIRTLLELLNSRSETSRLGAARTILDNLPLKKFLEEQGPEPTESIIKIEYTDMRDEIIRLQEARAALEETQRAAGVPVNSGPIVPSNANRLESSGPPGAQ